MEWIPVDSTSLESISYDPERLELWVRFISGSLYIYSLLPPGVYDRFLASESKGRFLNEVIKPRYPARRVE